MRLASILTGLVACSGLIFAAVPALAAAAQPPRRVGQVIESFALKDMQGAAHSLDDVKDAELVVVTFMGVECPLAKLYAPRLEELARKYEKQGVAFWMVDSNAQDSLAEMAHFSRTYGVTIPFLKDPGNAVADQFEAQRTPEVFVLDRQRVVRYRGRVDDQFGFQSGVGYQRPEAVEHDLADAIDELLAGKAVSQAMTRTPGCLIGRVRAPDEQSDVTYSNQIARLFQDHCVRCHRDGEIAPFSLSSYDEIVGWAPMIEEVVRENRMPPWHADPKFGHFANDARLSDEEKELLATWVANGAPEGDPADLPEPREFTPGWQISTPDRVIAMNDKPYTVPAAGTVEYQYFVVDPGFTEDVWVREAQARAGNDAVVHHIIVFVAPPSLNNNRVGTGLRNLLVGTAPGNPPLVCPPGMAKRIAAGSKLVFQMHYTANGSEQQDLSSVGLVFADPKTVTREAKTDMAINTSFEVPAGAEDFVVEAWRNIRSDSLLLSFMPHMHLRGKAFRYEVQLPDGTTETLLNIPSYDFNWQNAYVFEKPKFVPKGSKLHCIAHFDNSEFNLANPDPTEPVGWGDQTWEEMMIGFFDRAEADPKPNLAAPSDRTQAASAPGR